MVQRINLFHIILRNNYRKPKVCLSQRSILSRRIVSMPHTQTKAEAIHHALDEFQESHHHAPDTHEKARLISDAVAQWEHEEVEILHATHSNP